MTRRTTLEFHNRNLVDISNIMKSMKTLAYLEIRKLQRYITAQTKVVDNIEAVARDFVCFYPEIVSVDRAQTPVYLVIGSERGLCADFNSNIVEYLDKHVRKKAGKELTLIIVGNKLRPFFNDSGTNLIFVDGASISEEIEETLERIANVLAELQTKRGLLKLYVVSCSEGKEILAQQLLPPFQKYPELKCEHVNAPVLNLEYRDYFVELTEYYVLAYLHAILYGSLVAENQHRFTHLENAGKKISEKIDTLRLNINQLKQEEIIEEIEVILLNSIDQETR